MHDDLGIVAVASEEDNLFTFGNTIYLDGYYPFLTYTGNMSYSKPKNIDLSEIENKIDIERDGVNFEGRIIFNKENNNIIRFESIEEITEKYQNLELLKQLDRAKEENINVPRVRICRPEDINLVAYNDKKVNMAIEFFLNNIDIDEFNDLFEKTIHNLVMGNNIIKNKPIKCEKDLGRDYNIQVFGDKFALLSSDLKGDIKNSKEANRLFKYKDEVKYPATINNRKIEEFFYNIAMDEPGDVPVFKTIINKLSNSFLSDMLTPKNKDYDAISSFKLEGKNFINPDEWDKHVISETEICINRV